MKRKERKKKPRGKNIMLCPIPYGDHKYHKYGVYRDDDEKMSFEELEEDSSR